MKANRLPRRIAAALLPVFMVATSFAGQTTLIDATFSDTDHGVLARFSSLGHHAENPAGLPPTGATTVAYHYQFGVFISVIGDNIVKRVGMTSHLSTGHDQ